MVASEGDQCWLHHHDNTANFNKHLLDKVSVSISISISVHMTGTDRVRCVQDSFKKIRWEDTLRPLEPGEQRARETDIKRTHSDAGDRK